MTQDDSEDLNEALVDEFSAALEKTINQVVENNEDLDSRIELLTVLLSFSSQVAQDLNIDEDTFSKIAGQFYQESAIATQEELVEQQKYFPITTKTNYHKPN